MSSYTHFVHSTQKPLDRRHGPILPTQECKQTQRLRDSLDFIDDMPEDPTSSASSSTLRPTSTDEYKTVVSHDSSNAAEKGDSGSYVVV